MRLNASFLAAAFGACIPRFRAVLLVLGLLAWGGAATAQDNAVFVSQRVPASMAAGQLLDVSVVMQNTGSSTWTPGDGYRLGTQNPQDNTLWGLGRAYLTGPVAPGQQVAFNFQILSPMAAGTYNFQWRMVREGVAWFGGTSTNVAISVTAPAGPLIAPPPVQGAAGVPGRTPGQLAVSTAGQASFTLPIETPPGTNAAVPHLALQYLSGSGNGPAGVGWTVSGLSSIGRCAKDVLHDGSPAAFTLQSSDRYCMDGQRLVVVGGDYGAPNSEYRTEVHEFTRVIASPTASGAGPAAFVATDRYGARYEFGTGPGARWVLPGEPTGTPAAWFLSKVTDASGNYFSVSYLDPLGAGGQMLVSRIDYSGNAAAGLVPYNSVRFVYEGRPDIEWKYVAGYKVVEAARLARIETFNGEVLVRRYLLTYQTSAPTGRSRMQGVTECAGASGACLPATVFSWEDTPVDRFGSPIVLPDPSVEFPNFFTPDFGWWDAGKSYWVDLNGDGRADHCRASKHVYTDTTYDYETLFCNFSMAGNSGKVAQFGQFKPNANYQFVDVNADGILDVCEAREKSPNLCWLMGPSGPTGVKQSFYISFGVFGNFVQWADVNGDGLMDYCRVSTTGDLSCMLGAGGGRYGAATSLGTFPMPACMAKAYATCAQLQFSWANLSGDGVLWFCRIESGTMRCRKWTPGGLGPEVATPTGTDLGRLFANVGRAWADVNGDGKDDLCRVLADGSNRVACTLSTGTGFGDTVYSASIDTGFNGSWSDANGDGRADFCRIPNTATNTTACLLSTGSGFGASVSFPLVLQEPTAEQYSLAVAGLVDANADGKVDACSLSQCITASGKASDLLLGVTDGLGAQWRVEYGTLTDPALYAKGSGAVFPVTDIANASFVVSAVQHPNGVSGTMATRYRYETLRSHRQGLGSLGFAAATSEDPHGTASRLERRQDFPYVGLPSRQVVSHAGVSLSDATQSYGATAAGPTFTVQPLASVLKTNDLNGAFINWVETTRGNFDAFNNPQTVSTAYKTADGSPDGFGATRSTTYFNDTTNWLLGLPVRESETRTAPGQPQVTRTTAWAYGTTGGGLRRVQQRIDEPENGGLGVTNLRLVTAYTHDPYGNVLTRTVSGANIATRTEASNVYDAQGRFALSTSNALGQTQQRTFDPAFGTLLSAKDANNLSTTWSYDPFGRVSTVRWPDGTQRNYTRSPCANCVPNSAYLTLRTDTVAATGATAAPYERIYSDALDRPVMAVHPGFGGNEVYELYTYDQVGRLQSRSRPFYNTDPSIRWTRYALDSLGRVTQQVEPAGDTGSATASTTFFHDGRTRTTLNNNGVASARTINSQGGVVSVVDAQGTAAQSVASYQYDPWGNLTQAMDAAGNVTRIAYDLRGRKTQVADPDMGVRSFEGIDNLGQVTRTTDAKNLSTSFTYDLLGRMTSRLEPDLQSNWYFERDPSGTPCANGVGRLCQATASNGYSRVNAWDSLGRLASQTTTVDVPYTATRSYDAAGRLATFTYPPSTGAPLTLVYGYTAHGLLGSIRDAASGTAYWTQTADNSDGKLVQEVYGNGVLGSRSHDFNSGRVKAIFAGPGAAPRSLVDQTYAHDALGRLVARTDAVLGSTESFGYDALDRLVSANLTAPGVPAGQSSSFTYDALGNITSKSGAGSYAYAAGRPHAVSGVTGTVNGVPMPTYSYDAVGNMLTDGTRSFSWTSFNMPLTLAKTATASSPGSGSALFNYGPEHQRVKQAWTSGASTATTVYLDAVDFEKTTDTSGSTYRHHVKANGRIVAQVLRGPGGASVLYLVPDHQGSTAAVLDAAGAVQERQAFDPWGDRRFTNGASDPANTVIPAVNRGYTGHEMLDMGSLGLVHMNARVYDPTLGRFISADPTVSEPFSTQGLNRYAYVTNRPLDLTDPTGFEPIELQAVEVTGRRDLGFWGLEPGLWGMTGWRVPSVTRPARVVGLLPLAGAGYAVDSALGTPEKVRQAGRGLQLLGDGVAEWYRTTPWGKLSEIASNAAKGLLTWAEAGGADKPAGDKPTLESNPKHHPNSVSPEPSNVDELYDNSAADSKGVRWAKDEKGELNRFSKPSNGNTHWNGTTDPNTVDPIKPQNILKKSKNCLDTNNGCFNCWGYLEFCNRVLHYPGL